MPQIAVQDQVSLPIETSKRLLWPISFEVDEVQTVITIVKRANEASRHPVADIPITKVYASRQAVVSVCWSN